MIYLNAKSIDIAHHHPDEDERTRGHELTDLLTRYQRVGALTLETNSRV